jgi:hypothetical protein
LKHYELWDIGRDLTAELVQVSVKLAGVIWSRLELRVWRWPYRLLRNDDVTFESFLSEYECCRDVEFSVPFLATFGDMAALKSPAAGSLLRVLGRRATVTNMRLERKIAETRGSVPYSKFSPSVESLVYGGVVGEVDLHSYVSECLRT